MSSYCYSQSCYHQCCDVYGYCPTYSSNCYYYYNKSSAEITAGAIVGIIIGIVCLIVFIILVVYLCRRCRERSNVVYVPPPQHTTVYIDQPGQPPNSYNAGYNPGYPAANQSYIGAEGSYNHQPYAGAGFNYNQGYPNNPGYVQGHEPAQSVYT